MSTVIGLDVGTGSTKAVAVDPTGTVVARATSESYPMDCPRPGWAQLDPEVVSGATIEALARLTADLGPAHTPVALSLGAQSGSILPADAGGEPVGPLVTWMDTRARGIVDQMATEAGVADRVRRTSGWSLACGLGMATIAWQTAQGRTAERWLGVDDLICRTLTGEAVANRSNAAGTQLMNLARGEWDPWLCSLAGIDPGQLSPLVAPGTAIGHLTSETAELTGLPPDLLVVAGGHDQTCTAAALGASEPGTGLLSCGTAWVLTTVARSPGGELPPVEELPAGLNLSRHVAPGMVTLSLSLGGLGATLTWWARTAGRELGDLLDELRREGVPVPERSPFLIPLTGLPDPDGNVRSGGFTGLTGATTRADLTRAVLEGAALETAAFIESLGSQGHPTTHLTVTGGATAGTEWPLIMADALGLPLTAAPEEPWPALGAALLAGTHQGWFEPGESPWAGRGDGPAFRPDPTRSTFRRHRLETYRRIGATGPTVEKTDE